MKLSPELPARQILNNPRRVGDSGAVSMDSVGPAKTGASRQASPALFRDLALSLGLPRDALTASLISLAKFFSLPLDTKLLLHLRQQALSQAAAKTPGSQGPEKQDPPLAGHIRSAALAAAAAAGKGVVLSPEALGSYAAALAVDDRESGAPEHEGEPEDGAGQDTTTGNDTDGAPRFAEPEGGGQDTTTGDDADGAPRFAEPRSGDKSAFAEPEGGAEQDATTGDDADGAPRFAEPRGGDKSAFAERIEGRLPLLGVLNRIPGRDGRRWISLPFSFRSGGVDFRVSLRIALADTNSLPWKAERMALDIKTGRRRWSFMLENAPGSGDRLFARAVFGVDPPLKPGAERSLRELLGGVAEKLVLRDISGGALPEEAAGAAPWER